MKVQETQILSHPLLMFFKFQKDNLENKKYNISEWKCKLLLQPLETRHSLIWGIIIHTYSFSDDDAASRYAGESAVLTPQPSTDEKGKELWQNKLMCLKSRFKKWVIQGPVMWHWLSTSAAFSAIRREADLKPIRIWTGHSQGMPVAQPTKPQGRPLNLEFFLWYFVFKHLNRNICLHQVAT